MSLIDRVGLGGLRVATYEAGLLQARAHRALRNRLSTQLEKHDLTLPEWALLGQLHEKGSLRLTEISAVLAVESPLATNLVNGLSRKDLVERRRDTADARAKQVRLTAKGQALVPQTEKALRRDLREFLREVPPAKLAAYLEVLRIIAGKR